MNSKVFIKKVYNSFKIDKMNIFETILAIQEKYNLTVEEIVEILKEEKTLLKDLESHCLKNGLLKNNNKIFNIDNLFL